MERPCSAIDTATSMEAMEIIRPMAVRYGDDQIASVLNRLGRGTRKGKRWNQNGVAAARHTHSVCSQLCSTVSVLKSKADAHRCW
jgi:hypothetical protein